MQTLPQMTALLDGSLDVGFGRAPERFPAGLTGFIVDRQPLCLAIPSGHRLALELSADDPFIYQPTYSGSTMTVLSGKLRLPMLTYLRTSNLEGDTASAQSTVPKPQLDESQLGGKKVRADFGPAMRRR